MYPLILLLTHSLLTPLPPIKEVAGTTRLPLTISTPEQVEKLFHLPSLTNPMSHAPRFLTRNILPDDHPDVIRIRSAERHLAQARGAASAGDWNHAIEEGIVSWDLSRQDPDTALFIADQLRRVGRLSEALFYYRHAMHHALHPNFIGNYMPWDNREAIMRYADTCLQVNQWKEADTAYWKVISMLKKKPNFELQGIKTMAERVAYLYFALGVEIKNANYATNDFLPVIPYFQEAIRRTSLSSMRNHYTACLGVVIDLLRSAANDKIAAEKRAITEAKQLAAFEAEKRAKLERDAVPAQP